VQLRQDAPVDLELPQSLTFAFYGLVAWVLSAMFAAFRILAGDRVGHALWMRGLMVAWLGLPAYLAVVGVFWDFEPKPPHLIRIVMPMGVAVIAFCFSPWGREAARKLPISLLVGTQTFRLPLELVLYSLSARLVLPKEMTFAGYNFDIVTGMIALPLWWQVRRLAAPHWALWVFNVLGTLLLAVIVVVAVVSFPAPFGWYSPPNVVVAAYPWVWLPTFLVPAALCGHLLLFRKLLLAEPVRDNV